MLSPSRHLLPVLLLTWLLGLPSASAIIRRHDVPDAQYVVPATDYPAVVDLFISFPGDCLATLIATAGGLMIAGLSSFQDNGTQAIGTYGVEEFYTRVSQYTDWIEDRVPTPPTADAGPVVPTDAGEDASPAPGGCGCRLGGAPASNPWYLGFACFAIFAFWVRRRR